MMQVSSCNMFCSLPGRKPTTARGSLGFLIPTLLLTQVIFPRLCDSTWEAQLCSR